MMPVILTIEQDGSKKLSAAIMWSEELGCFVGHLIDMPDKRTGDTIGEVFDKLCLTHLEAMDHAMQPLLGNVA